MNWHRKHNWLIPSVFKIHWFFLFSILGSVVFIYSNPEMAFLVNREKALCLSIVYIAIMFPCALILSFGDRPSNTESYGRKQARKMVFRNTIFYVFFIMIVFALTYGPTMTCCGPTTQKTVGTYLFLIDLVLALMVSVIHGYRILTGRHRIKSLFMD